MKKQRITGDLKLSTGDKVDMNLSVIIFEEDGVSIYYCPALDISGYGKTEKEASESLKVVISEYFDYTVKKKTLKADLISLGWQLRKSIKKKITAPAISTLLETNDNFKRIFDNHSFRKIDTKIQIPAFA